MLALRGASAQQIRAFATRCDNLLRRYADALLDVDPGTDVRIAATTPLRIGQIVRVAGIVRRRQRCRWTHVHRKGDAWLVFA